LRFAIRSRRSELIIADIEAACRYDALAMTLQVFDSERRIVAEECLERMEHG